MSSPLSPARQVAKPRADWIAPLIGAGLVVALGITLGLQYVAPDKRVLSTLAGLLVFGVAWRLDIVSGIGLLALALPYPRGTVFGSTNLAFVLLLLLIWLLRITERKLPPPERTALDKPLLTLVLCYVLSFYNVEDSNHLFHALENFQLMIGTWMLFYLVANNIRTSADLERLHVFQTFAILSICLVSMYELNHPGGALIPGWIDFTMTTGTEFNTHNVRVGATFYDYELLSEFCALSLIFLIFMVMRARSTTRKVLFSGVVLLDLFVLFTTCTRGSIVSLAVGLLYMAFLLRRHLRVVPVTIIVAGLVASFLGMNWFVANFTRSGDLYSRFVETKFIGLAPDVRAGTWQDGWTRMLEHPLLGHGPYYSTGRGLKIWYWPHDVYLYIGNNVGFIGLAVFLWLLWRLWRITSPRVDDLQHPDYASAYLIIAHVQMAIFIVDETKIEYLRNPTYQFQVWLMFAMMVTAYKISSRTAAAAPRPV